MKKRRICHNTRLLIAVATLTLAALVMASCGSEPSAAPQPTTEAVKTLPAFQTDSPMLMMGEGESLSNCAYTSDNTAVAAINASDNTLKAISTGYATLTSGAKKCYLTVRKAPQSVGLRNSTVQQYGTSADGRWCKVKYGDAYGWLYNKAFEEITNYTDFTLETLPVMADDLIFETGTDKRAIFDYVYQIAYSTNEDDTTENLCVDYFTTYKGSCYTHAAMLCYLYNRCGYETLRLVGESAYEGAGEHSWCLTKTEEGWRHFDAQFFTTREADEQFGVTDETYYQWFHWDKTGLPTDE